jgi:hypothetical protein
MQNQEEMKAELERLRAENTALKKEKTISPSKEITFKIGEKGGLSVYGLGRFPVTLYKEQWLKLLNKEKEIRLFLTENHNLLKSKE